MNKINFFSLILVFTIVSMLCFSACSPQRGGSVDKDTSTKLTPLDVATQFTDKDKDATFDRSKAVLVTLADDKTVCDSSAVSVKGSTVTIGKEGTYLLCGTLSKGQVVVNVQKTEKVRLILDGASVSCETSAALYVKQADKVFVTLADNSQNSFSTTDGFVQIDDTNVDAAVFSKDDLTFNGGGSLTVNSPFGHGIVSKDDVVFVGGRFEISAAKSGVCANDSIRILDGNFNISAKNDGFHCVNEEASKLGYVFVCGGQFWVDSGSDGFETGGAMQILGGSFNLTCGKKGLLSKGNLLISGGELEVNALDDAVHSNANICVENGIVTCSTGDDGFHADDNLTVRGGTIRITDSYEGLEACTIDIWGGEISILASDDGINASGGKDQSGFGGAAGRPPRPDEFAANENCYVKIAGGVVKINSRGDGIDSNGNLFVTGGECYVNGPTSNMDSAIDFDGRGEITGGIVVAVGSSGMAQNFGSKSTQCSVLVSFKTRENGEISLTDSKGNILASFSPQKFYTCVLLSCAEMKIGETYLLNAGNVSQSVKLTSVIYGSGGMGGGPGGRPPR